MVREMTNQYMLKALEASKAALPACQPNPPVGAVVVHNTKIIASGYTQAPGESHAEVVAIDQLPKNINSAECQLYITLEPCSFQGRTPPCTDKIIQSGIKEIFIGLVDPDPRNNGKGVQQLKAAGLQVSVGIEQAKCFNFLSPFLLTEPI